MKRIKLTIVFCLLLAPVLQAASLTTIELRNRPAEEIIPIVKPLLAPGDVITGHGYKLFLRAAPTTVDEVRGVVDALDVAAKMLQISVFQGSKRNLEALSVSGSIQIQGDKASIGVGGGSSGNNTGGSIAIEDGNFSASGSADTTESSRQRNPVHRLRVAEGREAFIQTGGEVPYVNSHGDTVFKQVASGFYVLPRINGERVTLDIRPFRNQPRTDGSGIIETQSADTIVSGRVGEWLKIGDVTEYGSQTQRSGTSYSSSNSKRRDRIWIRADLVR